MVRWFDEETHLTFGGTAKLRDGERRTESKVVMNFYKMIYPNSVFCPSGLDCELAKLQGKVCVQIVLLKMGHNCSKGKVHSQ